MTAQAQAIAPNGAPRLNDDRLFRQQCYIDGAWVDADSGATFPVNNPATDEVLGTVLVVAAAGGLIGLALWCRSIINRIHTRRLDSYRQITKDLKHGG